MNNNILTLYIIYTLIFFRPDIRKKHGGVTTAAINNTRIYETDMSIGPCCLLISNILNCLMTSAHELYSHILLFLFNLHN